MFILGSQSPRRKEILNSLGLEFKVVIPNVKEYKDEIFYKDIPILNARLKGDEIAKQFPNDIVIAADTVVEFNNRLFNKPIDDDDAVNMLEKLSGNEHRVVTSVSIQQRNINYFQLFSEISRVQFLNFGRDTIAEYMKKVHVMDKAGSYAVQEHGSMIIKEIIGSVTNVMGLPIEKLTEALKVWDL